MSKFVLIPILASFRISFAQEKMGVWRRIDEPKQDPDVNGLIAMIQGYKQVEGNFIGFTSTTVLRSSNGSVCTNVQPAIPDHPQAVKDAGSLLINDRYLFTVGGNAKVNGIFEATDSVYLLDFTDTPLTWQKKSSLQVARKKAGMISNAIGDKIFVVGGVKETYIEVYDVVADQWTLSTLVLPVKFSVTVLRDPRDSNIALIVQIGGMVYDLNMKASATNSELSSTIPAIPMVVGNQKLISAVALNLSSGPALCAVMERSPNLYFLRSLDSSTEWEIRQMAGPVFIARFVTSPITGTSWLLQGETTKNMYRIELTENNDEFKMMELLTGWENVRSSYSLQYLPGKGFCCDSNLL